MEFVWHWPQIVWLVTAALSMVWAAVDNRIAGIVGILLGGALIFFGGFFTGGVMP